jgi:hypothetical protein
MKYAALSCVALGAIATGVCLASRPRFISYLYNKSTSAIATWFQTEVDKGRVDAQCEAVRSRVSKRAWAKLCQLSQVYLADSMEAEDTELEFVPLAYKYSRLARVELCCPKLSEANKKCAYHHIRKEMVANGVRKHQIVKSIHLAVALTFVRDADELEADHLCTLLDPLVEKCK